MLSKKTAAGDEIGWNFVKLSDSSQFSISAYQSFVNEQYKACGGTVSFMSRTTFTDWLFSWIVNFKIDFRQQCYICGENPDIIAADGTMIGINFRQSHFTPLELPTPEAGLKVN